MEPPGLFIVLLLFVPVLVQGAPTPAKNSDPVDKYVSKRTLDDGKQLVGLPIYSIFGPSIPPNPFLPPGLVVTPAPPVDPVAAFFKAKKNEFLNKLFNDINMVTPAPDLARRSVTIDAEEDETLEPTTTKPKIDPKVFFSKKLDFLTQLFKTINTTTPDPTMVTDPSDSTATTVKPTIVPPGFWVPFPKPVTPKPTKTPKPPKPEKKKPTTISPLDGALLQQILTELSEEPSPSSGKATRKVSFLDALLHRVTEAPPTTDSMVNDIETRSLFPPGYWIPPYIYAAKMGIYLDHIFDTLDTAASEDVNDPQKRSASVDPSAMILAELTALKNEMVQAYLQGAAEAKPAAAKGKPTPKPFKKPFWPVKTTVSTTPIPDKVSMLSDLYDELANLEKQLLGGDSSVGNADSIISTTSTPTTNYWAPDPAVADVAAFYKTKTQNFLSNLFSDTTVDDKGGKDVK